MSRYGQNALEVIHNLKEKITEVSAGLPEGVWIEAVYDRSELIHRAIDTLKRTLLEESLIVALVCVIFLMHVRSALVAILMLPVGVLIAFIAMRLLDMNSNLMSLGGVAIAIGVLEGRLAMAEGDAVKAAKRFTDAAPKPGPKPPVPGQPATPIKPLTAPPQPARPVVLPKPVPPPAPLTAPAPVPVPVPAQAPVVAGQDPTPPKP